MDTKEILIETDRYVYLNWLTSSITLLGHKTCASLRKFDGPENTVLDLGCGPGYHFRYIKKANFIGLDNMSEMVKKARQTVKDYSGRGRVIEGNIFNNPLPDNFVDSIISSGVFEHLLPLDRALSETRRVLRPGGELILLQPCEGPLYRLGRKFTTRRYIEKKLGINYQAYLDTEHVHKCGELLSKVGEVFKFDRMVGIPFWVPIISINAFMAVRFIK